jgi:NAD(P)-dependent dehydrogenase (short-subunit alcohol dehydrogenase family)
MCRFDIYKQATKGIVQMDMKLKTVLITGAAGGLGKATADQFIGAGFRVIAGDIAFPEMTDERPGREMIRIPLDVSLPASIKNARELLKKLNLSIDILVNNAGIFDMYPLSEHDPDRLEHILSVNTLGPVRLVQAFLPDLIANKGRVVQVSSESVKFPGAFQPYQISKIAMEAYSRSVRQELLLKGVRLVIIRPGAISTDLFGDLASYRNPVRDSVFKNEFDRFVRGTTRFVGRIVPPERVARLVFKAATTRRPGYIYRINNNPVLTLVSILPAFIAERSIIKFLGK